MNRHMLKLSEKLRSLQTQKAELQREYEHKMAEIGAEIICEEIALEKINEAITPYICKVCDGSGEERFTDAAGSRDSRKCRHCSGTGFSI